MGENRYITYTYENIQMGSGEVGCEDAKCNCLAQDIVGRSF
jgi:hypothetical protein